MTGKEIALIFEKTSTRTRSSFEVAAFDQGAHVTYLDPSGSQMGHKESVADTARVLGRMYDAIEFRGNRPERRRGARRATPGVPVYNGLTDEWHPTQMLADFLTMRRGEPTSLTTRSPTASWVTAASTWAARCSSRARSWAATSASAARGSCGRPTDVREIAASARAARRRRITITDDPGEALRGADFVHTDVWVSMGEAKGGLAGAGAACSRPTRSTREAMEHDRQPARRSSCTACRPSTTRNGGRRARSWSRPAWTAGSR